MPCSFTLQANEVTLSNSPSVFKGQGEVYHFIGPICHTAVWTCYARILLLYTHFGPVCDIAVNFITIIRRYRSLVSYCFVAIHCHWQTLPAHRRRTTWQPLSDRHQPASQQMQCQPTVARLWLVYLKKISHIFAQTTHIALPVPCGERFRT